MCTSRSRNPPRLQACDGVRALGARVRERAPGGAATHADRSSGYAYSCRGERGVMARTASSRAGVPGSCVDLGGGTGSNEGIPTKVW